MSNHSVELFLGPYRSGKTRLLIDELLAFKREQALASVQILVPSARYGNLLKQRIGEALCDFQKRESGSRTAGIFGLEILPFYQCCLQVLSKSAQEPLVIPEEIRPALVNKVLSELKAEGKLKALARVSHFHGTAAAILELIDELQRAGLSPADVIARLEASSCQESHVIELAHVYEAYWQQLKSLGYFDQKSLALGAREKLFAEPKIEHDLLIIEGFDRVSHLQAQIFSGLSGHSLQTKITFDYALKRTDGNRAESPTASFSGTTTLKQSAEDYLWKENSYKELLENVHPKIVMVEHGARLMSTDYSAATKSSQNLPNLEVLNLLDPFLEMVEVARKVKSAIAQRRVEHADIIVVTRSPEAYNGAIEAAFEDAGISYFIDGSRKIVELEAWRFIRNLFTLQENDFRRKDIADMLRSPYMNLEALSMTARDLSLLDRESYENGLIGGLATWSNFLKKKQFESFAHVLCKFLQSLESNDELSAQATVHAKRIEDIVERYMLLPASEADIRSAAAGQEREAIKALRRALKVLIMEERLLKHPREPFKQFFNKVNSLIEKANFARPKPQQAAVTICSAELVPNKPFKEVFICGVNEGQFPRHQRSSGFLSNDETKLWLSFGIDIRNPRHEPGFEKALFYSLTERAREQLTLSLTQFGSKGEETIPSFYLSEIEECLELAPTNLNAFARSETQALSVRDALSSALWHRGLEAAEDLALQSRTVEEKLQALKLAFSASLSRASGDYRNLFNGYLSDFIESGALNLVPTSWTASKLNDYGKCPFRYWASHVLDISPREEAQVGLNFKFIGMFYHKVLELFFSARAQQRTAEIELSDLLESAFERGVQWLEARSDFQAGPYWEQEKKDLKFRLTRFIERELLRIGNDEGIHYIPAMFEANFGTKAANSFPPLQIAGANGKPISISGTIDRVDLAIESHDGRKRARVLDYKSSSRSISAKEAERGRNLQLPIYALALEKTILPEHSVTEAHYLSISAAKPVGHLDFESDKHAHLKDHASALISQYVNDANQGVFLVKPNGNDVCKDCAHATVCRVAELKGQMKEEERDASFD